MIENRPFELLTEDLKKYVNLRIKLSKLEVIERTSEVGSTLISGMILTVIGFLFILFFSFFAGIIISEWIERPYSGFAIVAGFYLLIMIILIALRKKILIPSIRDNILNAIFNHVEKEEK